MFQSLNSLLQAFNPSPNMIPSWNQQISASKCSIQILYQHFLPPKHSRPFADCPPPKKKKKNPIGFNPVQKFISQPPGAEVSLRLPGLNLGGGGCSTLPANPTHPNTASHRYRPLVTARGTLNLLCQALLFSVTLPEGFTAQGSVFKCNHLAYHSMVVDHV